MQKLFDAQIVYVGMPDKETEVSMVAFAADVDGDGENFFVMNDDTTDEEYNLVCEGRSFYGGLDCVEVSGGIITFKLNPKAAEVLEVPQEFYIQFDDDYAQGVYNELEYLFSQSSKKPELIAN